MLNIFYLFWDLTDASQIFISCFLMARSCVHALNLLWWYRSRAGLQLRDWNPGGFRREISGSLQWLGTALPWSAKAAGSCCSAEEEDLPKEVIPVTKEGHKLQLWEHYIPLGSGAFWILTFTWGTWCADYYPFRCTSRSPVQNYKLPFWESFDADLPFLNSHCSFPLF